MSYLWALFVITFPLADQPDDAKYTHIKTFESRLECETYRVNVDWSMLANEYLQCLKVDE